MSNDVAIKTENPFARKGAIGDWYSLIKRQNANDLFNFFNLLERIFYCKNNTSHFNYEIVYKQVFSWKYQWKIKYSSTKKFWVKN